MGLENLPGGSYSLGLDDDLSGAGELYYSLDGARTFETATDDSIMKGLPMIQIRVK